MKDELCKKIMKEFAELRAKAYSYLTENNNKDKKAKDTKKCLIKRKLKLEDYCLEATQLKNKLNQLLVELKAKFWYSEDFNKNPI